MTPEVKETSKPQPVAPQAAPADPNIDKLADALTKLSERMDNRPVRPRSEMNFKRKPVPDVCPPGYAIITDNMGRGRKMVHLLMVMDHAQEVFPMEQQFGGRHMMTGGLVDKVGAGQLIVEQFCPYPPGHIRKGTGKLFNTAGYVNVGGVFYRHDKQPKGA